MKSLFSRSHAWLAAILIMALSAWSTNVFADDVITFSASELIGQTSVTKTTAHGCKVKVAMNKILQDASSEGLDGFAKYSSYGFTFTITADNAIHKAVAVGGYFRYNSYCDFVDSDDYLVTSTPDEEQSTVTTTVTPVSSSCKSLKLSSNNAVYVQSLAISVDENGNVGPGPSPAATTATFDFTDAIGRSVYYNAGAVITAPGTKVTLTVDAVAVNDRTCYHHSNGQLRFEKNTTFTIAAPAGATIKSIAIDGDYLAGISATGYAGGMWTGSAQSVTFTVEPNWTTNKVGTIDVECEGDIADAGSTDPVNPDVPTIAGLPYEKCAVYGTGVTITNTKVLKELITFTDNVTLNQIRGAEDMSGNAIMVDPTFTVLDGAGNYYLGGLKPTVSGKNLTLNVGTPLPAGKYTLYLPAGALTVAGQVSTALQLTYDIVKDASVPEAPKPGTLNYSSANAGEQTLLNGDVITFDADITLDTKKVITLDGQPVASATASGNRLVVQFPVAAIGRHTLTIPAGAVTVNNIYNQGAISISYDVLDADHIADFVFTTGSEKWTSTNGAVSATGVQGATTGMGAGLLIYKDYRGTNETATFTAVNGCKIESIVFDQAYRLTASNGSYSGKQWTGPAQSVTFSASDFIDFNLIQTARVTFSGTPAATTYTVQLTGDVPTDATISVDGQTLVNGQKYTTYAAITVDDIVVDVDDYDVNVTLSDGIIKVDYAVAPTATFRFEHQPFTKQKKDVTLSIEGGKYNDTYECLQLTTDGTLYFTAPKGYKISGVKFVTSSKYNLGCNLEANKGELEYRTAQWSGLEHSVVFTATYTTLIEKAIVTLEEFTAPAPFAPSKFTVNYSQPITNGGSVTDALYSIEVHFPCSVVGISTLPAGVAVTEGGKELPITQCYTTNMTIDGEVVCYLHLGLDEIIKPGTYHLTIPAGVIISADDEDYVNAAVDFDVVVPVLDRFDIVQDGVYDLKDVEALKALILAPGDGEYHYNPNTIGDLTKFIELLRELNK